MESGWWYKLLSQNGEAMARRGAALRLKSRMGFALIVLLGVWVISWQGCAPEPSQNKEPKIAATIFPLYDITRNVVGEKFETLVILPPGGSPHTYDLSPQQAMRLEAVALVFAIGHGLDDWTASVIEVAPRAKKVIVDKDMELKTFAENHDEGVEHAHEGVNPHYWLSITNAKIIAGNVAEEMISFDPQNEAYYRENLEQYRRELDVLKEEIQARLSGLERREMIVFHDSWQYYADEFGLQIVAAFEPSPGKPPTPKHLAELHEAVETYTIRSVFSEPQLSKTTIEQFVSDLGLTLFVLDPIGGVGEVDSYVKLMRYNTETIAEALSQ
ncbi:MAG: metal ABC transporter substrate-binding protein [Candidatus Abyssubacteria bacterium]